MVRQINQAGLDLVKSFESFSAEPYQDRGGVWTIGYGHTANVTADTPPIDKNEGEQLLRGDMAEAESMVESHIQADLNDNEFSALVSITENAGTGPLIGGLGRVLNAGNKAEAAEHFLLWDKEHIDGQLVESAGLLRRRKAERELFLTPVSQE